MAALASLARGAVVHPLRLGCARAPGLGRLGRLRPDDDHRACARSASCCANSSGFRRLARLAQACARSCKRRDRQARRRRRDARPSPRSLAIIAAGPTWRGASRASPITRATCCEQGELLRLADRELLRTARRRSAPRHPEIGQARRDGHGAIADHVDRDGLRARRKRPHVPHHRRALRRAARHARCAAPRAHSSSGTSSRPAALR